MGNKGSSLTKKSDKVVRQNPSRRNSGLTLIEKRVAYKVDVEMIEKEAISKMQKHPKGLNEELIPGNVDMTPDGTHLNEDSKSFIRQALLKIGVFTDEMNKRNISVADVQNIINAFGIIDFEDGEFLYNRNDFPSDYLFIAKTGIFRGLIGGEYKSEMRPSDVIGEMEFFYQMPRTQSIEASRANGKNPSVYCLSKRDFKWIVEKGRDLGSMRMLQALSDAQKYLVKDKVTIKNHYRGNIILKRKSIVPCIYVILSGQVGVTRDGRVSYLAQANSSSSSSSSNSASCQDEITFMYPGDYFGEERFLRGVERSSRTFVAVNEVTLCVISQALFDDHQTFGTVRAWIENDVNVRERVKSVRILRKQRSLSRGLGAEQRGSSLKSIWALADEGQDKPSSALRKSTVSSYGSSSSSSSSHIDGHDHDPISQHDAAANCEPCAFDLMCCSPSHNAAPDPVSVSVPRT